MNKYRRRKISFDIAIVFMMLALAGCGGSDDKAESLDTVDPSKYVTLGEYKGLKLDGADTSVSDDDVESSIQNMLASEGRLKEVTDRPAQIGDTVNIDYVGKRDGVAFDTGTGTSDLKLGSGQFIPGFEDGVVGMKTGEEKDLSLTFPENYSNAELAGADVVFHVKVNTISEDDIPELTDEYVQSLDNGTKTVEEYKQYVKDQLTEQNESEAKANEESELLQMAVDNAVCDNDKLPEWLVSQNAAEFKSSTEAYVSQFGMTLDDYLAQMGSEAETFNSEAEEYGKEKAKSDLVVLAIAKAEGLEVTDQEIENFYSEYASNYGSTVEQMKNAIPEDEIKRYLLQQEVMDLLYDNADIKVVVSK